MKHKKVRGAASCQVFTQEHFCCTVDVQTFKKTVNGDTSVVEVPLPWFILAVA